MKPGLSERDVQQALIDLTIEHGLTQVHDQEPIRLVFNDIPSIIKTSTSIPGISDHAMVVTNINIIPNYISQKPRNI